MRIISQDGKSDIPYEKVCLYATSKNSVIACSASDIESDVYFILGAYSTEEKAIKAMEMCREKYLRYQKVGTNMVAFEPPKVFQFPADEEV